jgi:hypothetical protein
MNERRTKINTKSWPPLYATKRQGEKGKEKEKKSEQR